MVDMGQTMHVKTDEHGQGQTKASRRYTRDTDEHGQTVCATMRAAHAAHGLGLTAAFHVGRGGYSDKANLWQSAEKNDNHL